MSFLGCRCVVIWSNLNIEYLCPRAPRVYHFNCHKKKNLPFQSLAHNCWDYFMEISTTYSTVSLSFFFAFTPSKLSLPVTSHSYKYYTEVSPNIFTHFEYFALKYGIILLFILSQAPSQSSGSKDIKRSWHHVDEIISHWGFWMTKILWALGPWW